MSNTANAGANGQDNGQRALDLLSQMDVHLGTYKTNLRNISIGKLDGKLILPKGISSESAYAHAFARYIEKQFRDKGMTVDHTDAVRWYLGLDVPRDDNQFIALLETLHLWDGKQKSWKLNVHGQPLNLKGVPLNHDSFDKDKGDKTLLPVERPLASASFKLYHARNELLQLIDAMKEIDPTFAPLPKDDGKIPEEPVARSIRPLKGDRHGAGIATYNDRFAPPRAHDPYTVDYVCLRHDELQDIQRRTQNFHEFVRASLFESGITTHSLEMGTALELPAGRKLKVRGWETEGELPKFENLMLFHDIIFKKRHPEMGVKLVALFVKGKVLNAFGMMNAAAADGRLDDMYKGLSQNMSELPREYWLDVLRKAKDPDAWEKIKDNPNKPIWYDSVIDTVSRRDYITAIRHCIDNPERNHPLKPRFTAENSVEDFLRITEAEGFKIQQQTYEGMENQSEHMGNHHPTFNRIMAFAKAYCERYPASDFAQVYSESKLVALPENQPMPQLNVKPEGAGRAAGNGAGNGNPSWAARAGEPAADHTGDIAADRADDTGQRSRA